MVSVTPIAGFSSEVKIAQKSVLVAGADAIDGYIVNPGTIVDQGLDTLNVLYVDTTGPAAFVQTNTTTVIQPGGRFDFPPNVALGIWVNSQASGHKFISVQIVPTGNLPVPQPILDAAYLRGIFPPIGVTGVTKPIPSYLYQEYSDDDNLQGFVAAYNSMMQDIVDTFNGLNLADYTKPVINGALLDWVAQGIYGFPRPSLLSGQYKTTGPYNTGGYNTQQYDWWQLKFPDIISVTNDDLFKRILTWHISKRDGKYFNIEWLKKRIMRFLYGINGTQPNIDNSYQVSITFGPNYECTIRFLTGNSLTTGGAIYDQNKFTYNSTQYNDLTLNHTNLIPLPYVEMFEEAVRSGILELPFQYKYVIVVG